MYVTFSNSILNLIINSLISFFQVIRWPDHNEHFRLNNAVYAATFNLCSPLNGIIGALDGIHMRLASCPGKDSDYLNRKSFASMQLQVPTVL